MSRPKIHYPERELKIRYSKWNNGNFPRRIKKELFWKRQSYVNAHRYEDLFNYQNLKRFRKIKKSCMKSTWETVRFSWLLFKTRAKPEEGKMEEYKGF